MATPTLLDLLKLTAERKASDLHVRAGGVPHLRINGSLESLDFSPIGEVDSRRICLDIMTEDQKRILEENGEVDFAFSHKKYGRFRMNVYSQRGTMGMACRRVLPSSPAFEVLGLPPAVKAMADERRGLILITGPTSSGKTTTVGSLLDHINSTRPCHILTIEDPIEILHKDKKAIVSQREIGTDTSDFASGLRAAMRQDPDVIFIGEIRDEHTVSAALQAAETGHLVISTLHTTDVSETINRIIDFYEPYQHAQVRTSVAGSLTGIVSQRLLPRIDGRGQVPASEVLVMNGRVHDLITDPKKTHLIRDLIAESSFYGMQTFDQSLLSLFRSGLVSLDDVMTASTSPHDLQLALRQEGLQAVP